jgi:hypothetical protein
MKFIQFLASIRLMRGVAGCLCVLVATGISAPGQTAGDRTHKSVATKIEKQILIFPDSVVVEQWAHTLRLVNPPQNLKLLNPGECIRIGIVAVGDDRDSLLEKTQLSFRVEFAGQTQDHALAPLSGTKQIKPEGGDFVLQVLAAANVEAPPLSMASMGASSEKWCVPDDAQDGTATIEAEIEFPAGHEKLARATIAIESFETGSKHAFKDEEEMEKFTMGYHYQPNPARLYPELLIFCSDEKLRSNPDQFMNQAALLSAALKAYPAAARDFLARVATRDECPRHLGLLGLLMAGYDITPALQSMNESDRLVIQQLIQQRSELPDPYKFDSPAEIPAKFDMLWAIFCSTGQFAPIQKIASGLVWRSDWEEFDAARKSRKQFKEWTPAIGRAMAYSVSGWSISSFQRSDPLAADYIDFMIASPDTPDAVKTELKGLVTNPAFKQEGDK